MSDICNHLSLGARCHGMSAVTLWPVWDRSGRVPIASGDFVIIYLCFLSTSVAVACKGLAWLSPAKG